VICFGRIEAKGVDAAFNEESVSRLQCK